MRIFIFCSLILLIFTNKANGQENSKADTNDFSLEIFAGPEYHYRSLIKDRSSGFSNNNSGTLQDSLNNLEDSLIDLRNETQEGRWSFSAGIGFNYHYSESFHLQSGIWYSRKGYDGEQTKGFGNDTLLKQTLEFRVHYLEIPLILKFRVFDQPNWSLWFNPGFLTQFALKDKTSVTKEFKDGTTENLTRQRSLVPFNIAGHAALEFQYNINDNLSMVARPYGKYMIGPAHNGTITEFLYSYGGSFGVNYKF